MEGAVGYDTRLGRGGGGGGQGLEFCALDLKVGASRGKKKAAGWVVPPTGSGGGCIRVKKSPGNGGAWTVGKAMGSQWAVGQWALQGEEGRTTPGTLETQIVPSLLTVL